MAANTTLKVINATGDTNALLTGITHVWGIIARNSGTAASEVALHDALTVTGTAKIGIAANPTGFDAATTFEESYGVMFPQPVKFRVGVSINVTNANPVDIYYS